MSHQLLQRDRSAFRPVRPEPVTTAGKTKGQVEAEIAEAVVGYHRTRYGRGPVAAKTHFMDDIVVVRQRGTLTLAEARLSGTGEGWDLVKQMRQKLAEVTSDELAELIRERTGQRVLAHFTDISRAGDQVDVFILDRTSELYAQEPMV